MTNLTIGYFLMNISMCYYSGHMIAIVIGKFGEISIQFCIRLCLFIFLI